MTTGISNMSSWKPQEQPYRVDVYRTYQHPRDRWKQLRVQFFSTYDAAVAFGNAQTDGNVRRFCISKAINTDNWITSGSWVLIATCDFPGPLKVLREI